MANWCYNDLVFISDNKEKITKLHKEMLTWYEAALKKNKEDKEKKKDHTWFMDFIHNHGGENIEDTRAFVTWISDDVKDDYFYVDVESAYSPIGACVAEWLEMYDPDNEIDFHILAEEPGCEIYINTDTYGHYFNDKYCLCCGELTDAEDKIIKDECYYRELDDVRERIGNITSQDCSNKSVEEMNDMLETNGTEITIYEYTEDYDI